MAWPITAEFGQTVPETQGSCFSVSVSVFFSFCFFQRRNQPRRKARLGVCCKPTFSDSNVRVQTEFTFAAAKLEAAFFFLLLLFFSSNKINFAGKWNLHFQQQLSLNGMQLFFLSFFQRQNQLCRTVTLGVCCKLTLSDFKRALYSNSWVYFCICKTRGSCFAATKSTLRLRISRPFCYDWQIFAAVKDQS